MSEPKSILKKSKNAAAGPSKLTGSKGKAKATVAVKTAKVKEPSPEPGSSDDNDFGDDDDDEYELDTDDEIELLQAGPEKKQPKRKRPTTASEFGTTLTSLLTESTSKKAKKPRTEAEAAKEAKDEKKKDKKPKAQPILALSAKPLPRSQAAERLERRAARVLKAERMERLDRARVRDVVEGWVPAPGAEVGSQEFERGLRKTAQRGVIKLFNAILVASKNAEQAAKTLSDKAGVKPEAPKSRKEKDNILGRGGKDDVLTKESFLDLVRRGSAK